MLALDTIIFLTILLFPQPSACVHPGEELIQQYLEMDLEGRTVPLMVPKRFTEDAADRVQGAIHGAQLFAMDTTTFEPVTRRETGDRMRQGRIEYLRLLLSDIIDLDRLLRAKFKGFNPTEHDAYTKGFEFKPHESGLDLVVGENAPIDKAIFYLGPKDSPVLVAQCSKRNTKFQLCALFFETHGLEVKMTIDKREFARWKEIKAGVDRFLACITTL